MRFWSKREKPTRLRLFFATDIHGSEQCYRKWLNAHATYGVDVLILGGDITGKTLVPIVADGEGGWQVEFLGRRERIRDRDQLADLQSRVRKTGAYDLLLDVDRKATLDQDSRLVAQAFENAMRSTLRRWVDLAEQRIEPGTPCFLMLGNDDLPGLADVLRSSSVLRYAEDEVMELPGGYEMISFGYSTPTPWNTPREITEIEMADRLSKLAGRLTRPERAIFNIHCPPKGTVLDQAPLLDDNFKPVTSLGGGVKLQSVGSQAVREVIEHYQPLLGLHGHIHECSAGTRLGRTLCINPGSDYTSGRLRGAIVELEGDQVVTRWQLTAG